VPLADAIELVSYRFEPDGLVFDEPVELAVNLPALIDPSEEELVLPLVLASTFSQGTLAFLSRHDLAVDLDSGDAVLNSEIEHFSDLSAQFWEPTTSFSSPYFYFQLAPKPPAQMELTKAYGIGLSFFVKRFLAEDLPLTYTDRSEGLIYSGGTAPVAIGSIPGAADAPSSFVVDAGSYRCAELGAARYEALLVSDEFWATPTPGAECESATDDVKCGGYTGLMRYLVKLGRQVECVREVAEDPEPPGAPFGGYVAYSRSHVLSPLGTASAQQALTGGFYEGGADQAAFDSVVLAQRRALGIMPDRGANATCRSAEPQAYEPNILALGIEFSHVGLGADDRIGLDFLSPPSEPLYTASFVDGIGLYDSDFVHQEAFTDQGLAVHIPASAATPTIVLPGWNENITRNPVFTPNNALAALNGDHVAIMWQADEVGGDRIHIWGVGNDADSPARAFECFVEVEDQLLIIPSETISGLFPTATDPISLTIFVNAGTHTTAEYRGKTLDGFNMYQYGREEQTADPNNPDG